MLYFTYYTYVLFISDYIRDDDNYPGPSGNQRLRYKDVYFSESEDEPNQLNTDVKKSFSASDITDQTFVVVKLEESTNKKTKHITTIYRYAAVCQGEIDEEGELGVIFLRVICIGDKSGQLFRLDEKDYSTLDFEQIKCTLNPP